MFELSGVHYEEVLEQGDSILVRVIASSSYRGFELSGLYCTQVIRKIKTGFTNTKTDFFPYPSGRYHPPPSWDIKDK